MKPRFARLLKSKQIWLAINLLACLWLAGTSWQTVTAHAGGTLQLAGVPAGPYLVTAWTSPPDARASSPFHVTVGVADAATDEILLDVAIQVQVTSLGAPGEVLVGEATIVRSVSKLLYETADFQVPGSGRYQVNTTITGAKGEGEASFEMQVLPALNINWLVWGLSGLGIVAVVILFRSWHSQAAQQGGVTSRPRRRRPADRPSPAEQSQEET